MIQNEMKQHQGQIASLESPFGSATMIGSIRLLRPRVVMIKTSVEIPPLPHPLHRIAGWNLIDGTNAYDLDTLLRKNGWYFLFFAQEIKSTAIAFTYEAALRNAVTKVFRKMDLQRFNSFEIIATRSRSFLRVSYLQLIVHPHQVQRTPYARDLDPHRRVRGIWDFKRIHQVIDRKIQQRKVT